MAEQLVIQCGECKCNPLQLSTELLQEIAEKNSELVRLLVSFKKMLGYCHEKETIFTINV